MKDIEDEELEFWEEVQDKVWPHVVAALRAQETAALKRIADPATTVTIEDVRQIQGEIQALRALMQFVPRRVRELQKKGGN